MSHLWGRINTQNPINWNATLNQGVFEIWESLPGGAGIYKGNNWKGLLRRVDLTPVNVPRIAGSGGSSKDVAYGSFNFDGNDDYFELPFDARFNLDAYTIHAVYATAAGVETLRSIISTRFVNTGPTTIKGYVFWGRDVAENRSAFWQGDGTNAAWDVANGYPVSRTDYIISTVTYQSPNMYLVQNTREFNNSEGQYVKAVSPAVLRVGASKNANDGNGGGNAAAALFLNGKLASLRFYPFSFTVDKARALNTEAMSGYRNLYNWD